MTFATFLAGFATGVAVMTVLCALAYMFAICPPMGDDE